MNETQPIDREKLLREIETGLRNATILQLDPSACTVIRMKESGNKKMLIVFFDPDPELKGSVVDLRRELEELEVLRKSGLDEIGETEKLPLLDSTEE